MKQFLRNFRKQKVVGTLNIMSLCLGIMVSIVIGLWTINELSYDSFHKDADRIYKVMQKGLLNGEPVTLGATFKPLAEMAKAEIPEIEDMCRVVVDIQGVTFNNQVNFGVRTLVTDHNFFDFFSFPLISADSHTAFSGPANAIITRSAAEKYFPGKDPIGERVSNHGFEFHISAIMEDFPKNSHIQGEFVFPLYSHFKEWQWESSYSYEAYMKLFPGADISRVEEGIAKINAQWNPELFPRSHSSNFLLPIKDVHFYPTDGGMDAAIKGDRSLVRIFVVIGLLILAIACINFANLFVSTSLIRSKSIGIRKAMGESKLSLMLDFYRETAVYVLIAAAIGVVLAYFTLPIFNGYVGSDLTLDFSSPTIYIFLIALSSITILAAGSFPALHMTHFGIIETLAGRFKGKKMSVLQMGLVIVQFTSSIFLLIVVAFFGRQIDTLLKQDLGFDKENVIYVYAWSSFGEDYTALRNEMIRDPSIFDVAMRQYRLQSEFASGIGVRHPVSGETLIVELNQVSANYFDFFGVDLLAGENPLKDDMPLGDLDVDIVINQATASAIGLTDPLGKIITLVAVGGTFDGGATELKATVRGVVRDSNFKSLRQGPLPEIYSTFAQGSHNNPIFFKIAGDPQQAIKVIREKWEQTETHAPFSYHYLDDNYRQLYSVEISTARILSYALLFSLIITAAGLFGVSYYSAQRRVKEIAIRKVNGATEKELLLLLNKNMVIWVAVSFVIAVPVSILFLKNWLAEFVVRTTLSVWVFLAAGLVALAAGLLTVSYQTWKTASANPVDSLKKE